MPRKLTCLALSLLLWTSACSIPSIFSLTPTPTPYIYPTAETPPIPPLTVDQLKNAEYVFVGFDGASYAHRFVNGVLTQDSTDLRLLDMFAFGDLNEDGVDDAAVLIAADYDEMGRFVSVNAVLNEDGQPRHAASSMIDDRPQVKALEIRGGIIILDAIVHGMDDPACCPTWSVTRSFKLIGAELTLVRAATRLPNGQERAVTIESPPDGVETRGELAIAGSVTILPFENTLNYHVYNEQGNELAAGLVTVSESGTFKVTLNMSGFLIGRVRIVIIDSSGADGSILALDSVEVIVR